MTEQKIGSQLDGLGLTVAAGTGSRVVEAVVTLTTEISEDGGLWHHPPQHLPVEPGSIPVPHPVEDRVVTVVRSHQSLSPEQLERIRTWLKANDIDPDLVSKEGPVTVECRVRDGREGRHLIGFTEYYVDSSGHRVVNEKLRIPTVLTLQRWVKQVVPIAPEPAAAQGADLEDGQATS